MQSCLKVSVSLTVRWFHAAACGVSWCTRSVILESFSSALKHDPPHTQITEYYFWEIIMLLMRALTHKCWSGKGIVWSLLLLRRHLFYGYREKQAKQCYFYLYTQKVLLWMNSVHDLNIWCMHLFVHSWGCCNRPFRESIIYPSIHLSIYLTVLYYKSGRYLSYQSSMFRFRWSLRMPYCLFVYLFIHFILLYISICSFESVIAYLSIITSSYLH